MKRILTLIAVVALAVPSFAMNFRPSGGGVSDHGALTSTGTLTHDAIESALTGKLGLSGGTMSGAIGWEAGLGKPLIKIPVTDGTSPSLVFGPVVGSYVPGISIEDGYIKFQRYLLAGNGAKTLVTLWTLDEGGNWTSDDESNMMTVSSITARGTVTAQSFHGDGSALTGITDTDCRASTATIAADLLAVKQSTPTVGVDVPSYDDFYAVKISTGVTRIKAGTNISVDQEQGQVTISASGEVSATDDLCRASTGYIQTQLDSVQRSTYTMAAIAITSAQVSGINLYTPTSGLSIANWNTAYGWGNHASAGYASAATLAAVQASTITIGSAETQAASGTHTHTGTYAPSTHNHAGTDINSGTVGIDYLPTGTGATNVALGNHAHTGVYAAYSIGVDTGTLRDDVNAVRASTITVGTGATNAAAGNHAHSGVYQPVGDYAVNADTLTIGTGATNAAAGNHNHTGTYIGTAGVTYEQLDSNGDVGTSAGQLAIGNHTHSYQASDADLTAIAGLSSADGNFIVGSATGWVAESGATALASIGAAAASHNQAASTITDAVVDLQSVKVGTSTIALGVAAANVKDGSLGASVIASSVAINAVRKESLKDICLDGVYCVLGSTTTAGTKAVRISPYFDGAVTISTITVMAVGSAGGVFNIEERTVPATAGTDVGSDITVSTTAWTGYSSMTNSGIAKDAALYLVPTSWAGSVDFIEIKGWATRD